MLQSSASKTGGAFVSTTSSDNFEVYLKGVKNSFQNVNFKGVTNTFTQDIPGETPNDKDIRITKRVRDIVESEVQLKREVINFVNNIGFRSKKEKDKQII